MQVAAYQKEKPGMPFCGDHYFYKETDDEFICALADGLGTGEYAEESAKIVIGIIESNPQATLDQVVALCNVQLHGKRGVVLGILKINFKTKIYTVSTIGNIGIIFIHGKKRWRHIPHGGYLAGFKRKFKTENGRLENNMYFLMYSDGVNEAELTPCIFHDNVNEIITNYHDVTKSKVRHDDTTLIAIRYHETEYSFD